MRLSKNFSLEEFTKSDKAKEYGIRNIPTVQHITNMQNMCADLLQPLRDMIGKSFNITSGYRSSALNLRLNGKTTSQHLTGCAVDFVVDGMSCRDVCKLIENSGLTFDQVIFETKNGREWVHLSYDRKKLRQEPLTCVYKKGCAIYTKGIA